MRKIIYHTEGIRIAENMSNIPGRTFSNIECPKYNIVFTEGVFEKSFNPSNFKSCKNELHDLYVEMVETVFKRNLLRCKEPVDAYIREDSIHEFCLVADSNTLTLYYTGISPVGNSVGISIEPRVMTKRLEE